jgi:23S rRNA (cytosine1962-C5)-methyltransferase
MIDQNLITQSWDDYALIDTGEGRKLERYGAVIVDRPETQALWPKSNPDLWANAHAKFSNSPKDEDGDFGNWEILKPSAEDWPVKWRNLSFECRLMSFRHMGLFPEQASHWDLISDLCARGTAKFERPLKILNLFAYTGAGTMVAASHGAEVVHLDASKKAIGWAKDNQKSSGLEKAKIRWICDDATDFVEREIRRGNQYDGIILDPPKYGRGPDGQIWSLERDLANLLSNCSQLLSNDASFMLMTCYALRLSPYSLDGLMKATMDKEKRTRGGKIQSGELLLKADSSEYLLPTSLYSLWSRI